MWREVEPSAETRRSLASLSSKVTRIGHSASLVQMWVAGDSELTPSPNWVPDDDRAVIRLRVATQGTLDDLERRFNGPAIEEYASILVEADNISDKKAQKAARDRLKEEFGSGAPPRHRPHLSVFQGYAPSLPGEEASPVAPGTFFSPHILPLTLERLDGPYRHLDLLSVLAVCQGWRKALCSQCDDLSAGVASILSGHAANGTPLDGPHLAFVPLAFIGSPKSDGHLLGIGLALPEAITRDERRGLFTAIGRVRELKLGRLGCWQVDSVTSQRPLFNLVPDTWTGYPKGATHWASVTPIAFDQHAKAKDKAAYQTEIAGTIRLACQRIGLPDPKEVIVAPVSAHLGVPPAHAFPRLLRKDGSERRHSHAILIFEQSVRGPILLGAGRYRGYGLCRPMAEES